MAVAVTSPYPRAVAALESLGDRRAHTRAADLERGAMKLGLERITALLEALGNPQLGLRGVLVAGTNGKGSVCALVESMCRAAGLRTVLMTKPHLVSWTERIAVDGRPVTDGVFADLVDRVLDASRHMAPALGGPTVFETLTAAGVVAASAERPDVLVTEVGLGGRLDSTNVLDLGVAVVTGIAVDHRAELGDDPVGIAAEKAAIIKPGDDVVTAAAGAPLEVIRRRAADVHAASFRAVGTALPFRGDDRAQAGVSIDIGVPPLHVETPLIGAFQQRNLAVAVEVCRALRERGHAIPDDAIARGAATVSWPGRMQWIDGAPALLVDGAHNPDAIASMVAAAAPLCAGRRTVVVFGAMTDKDIDGMLAALRALTADVVFTQPSSDRAAAAADLAARWPHRCGKQPDLRAAIAEARDRAGPAGVVVVTGSLYIAGEALSLLGLPPAIAEHPPPHSVHRSH